MGWRGQQKGQKGFISGSRGRRLISAFSVDKTVVFIIDDKILIPKYKTTT